jgi:glutamate decarboxylase
MSMEGLERPKAMKFGGEWLLEASPDNEIPEEPMTPLAASRLIDREMVLDGIPERNLATFVTTWM